jgi:hypothetical protein
MFCISVQFILFYAILFLHLFLTILRKYRQYPKWLERRVHVVAPNKRAFSGPLTMYHDIKKAMQLYALPPYSIFCLFFFPFFLFLLRYFCHSRFLYPKLPYGIDTTNRIFVCNFICYFVLLIYLFINISVLIYCIERT